MNIQDPSKISSDFESPKNSNNDLARICFDLAEEMFVSLDREGKVTLINKKGCDILGYPEGQILGRDWFSNFIPEHQQKEMRRYFSKMIDDNNDMSTSYQNPILNRAGQEVYISWSNFILRDASGGISGTLSSGVDISQTKQTERKFGLVFESSPVALLLINPKGIIELANLQAQNQFGYSSTEMVGQPVDILIPEEFQSIHQSHRKKFMNNPESRKMGTDKELYGLRKDGSRFSVEVGLSPLQIDNNTFVLTTVIDITERKESENALKQSEEKLKQSQKMEAMGRLAGGVAHDFNNILATILLNTDLLEDELEKNPQAEQELKSVEDAVNRGQALTKQLLAFSRRQVMSKVPISPNSVIENLVKMLDRILGENIKIELVLDTAAQNILADTNQFEQVILNLAINARDSMPNGGKLVIQTKEIKNESIFTDPEIETYSSDLIMVSVQDSGLGMDKETLTQIFEPFFTTKDSDKGTGLGLSTVYGIVKQFNGTIKVYSNPNMGTCFQIFFPSTTLSDQKSKSPQSTNIQFIKGQGKILVVEDETPLRLAIIKVLKSAGYEPLEAKDKKSVLSQCHRHQNQIRAAIMDVVLPDQYGPTIFQEIRSLYPKIRSLFISGYIENSLLDSMDINAEQFLGKPFNSEELLSKLAILMNRK